MKTDYEELWAFADGELEATRASRIEWLVQTDPAWSAAYKDLKEFDAALGVYAPPPVPTGLAQRIVDNIVEPPKHRVTRIVRWLAPAAAAAALIVLTLVLTNDRPMVEPTVAQESRAQVDELVSDNLDFFQNYDVLANYDTLAAIEDIDSPDEVR